MKEFKAIKISDNEIILSHIEELKELYTTIEQDENFILKIGNKSELIISNNISAKINNGDIVLKSEEK